MKDTLNAPLTETFQVHMLSSIIACVLTGMVLPHHSDVEAWIYWCLAMMWWRVKAEPCPVILLRVSCTVKSIELWVWRRGELSAFLLHWIWCHTRYAISYMCNGDQTSRRMSISRAGQEGWKEILQRQYKQGGARDESCSIKHHVTSSHVLLSIMLSQVVSIERHVKSWSNAKSCQQNIGGRIFHEFECGHSSWCGTFQVMKGVEGIGGRALIAILSQFLLLRFPRLNGH